MSRVPSEFENQTKKQERLVKRDFPQRLNDVVQWLTRGSENAASKRHLPNENNHANLLFELDKPLDIIKESCVLSKAKEGSKSKEDGTSCYFGRITRSKSSSKKHNGVNESLGVDKSVQIEKKMVVKKQGLKLLGLEDITGSHLKSMKTTATFSRSFAGLLPFLPYYMRHLYSRTQLSIWQFDIHCSASPLGHVRAMIHLHWLPIQTDYFMNAVFHWRLIRVELCYQKNMSINWPRQWMQ
ncbi:hypothetical protein LguiB_028411 [Lonicera macranthoides]